MNYTVHGRLLKGGTSTAEEGREEWKALKSWDYAQEAFTGWAQAFRAYLGRVHAKSAVI
jgi:hypothetical protein